MPCRWRCWRRESARTTPPAAPRGGRNRSVRTATAPRPAHACAPRSGSACAAARPRALARASAVKKSGSLSRPPRIDWIVAITLPARSGKCASSQARNSGATSCGRRTGRKKTPRAPAFGRALDDMLDLVIGDRRDDRRDRHEHRDARIGQPPHRGQPALGVRRARLDGHRDPAVERGHRHRHRRQPLRRHRREQVDVAHHAVGLGGDGQRMVGLGQHLDAAARDPPIALDRLIGIGVGPERDRPADIAALRQLLAQQHRRVGLGEQLALEIEPRRQIVIGVGRPREAIDAAMLAPAIRVDRAVEADVGRLVAGDDRAAASRPSPWCAAAAARRPRPRSASSQSPSARRSGRLKRMLSRLSVAPRTGRAFAIATMLRARART